MKQMNGRGFFFSVIYWREVGDKRGEMWMGACAVGCGSGAFVCHMGPGMAGARQ